MKRLIFWLPMMMCLLIPILAQAQETQLSPQITVSGEGETALAPDMAVLSLTVLREGKTAREAVTANNEAMAAILDAMTEAGVAERDLRTSGFAISPRYHYPKNNSENKPPVIVGYNATNTIVVRVRELARAGELLDRSVSLGVNQGGSISFINEDPSEAIQSARTKAVRDALDKAKTLSEAAGVRIGRILQINENTNRHHPAPRMESMAMKADAGGAVPFQSGENNYNVQVQMTFEINQ